MVAAVRRGRPMRQVARDFDVGLFTVQRWVQRAHGGRLDQVPWADRSSRPRRTYRTPRFLEDLVLLVRQELRDTSDLGEFGAAGIRAELLARDVVGVPSVRTVGRILERRGVLDARRRVRRPPPPRGWYLPAVARGDAELESVDIIEGLYIHGGPHVEVINLLSFHGGLVASWPTSRVTAKTVVDALVEHWRALGLPTYVQFDNDAIFQGPHHHRDSIGRVTRLCLSLGVTPVFAPPREPGFQAAIESFNGRWQAKVWARAWHDSLASVQQQSARYVTALRRRAATRTDSAPARRPIPPGWTLDLQAPPRGVLIYLRRTTERGAVHLLGRTFDVDPTWPFRLVRCEVHLDVGSLRCYALRRRQPDQQPLLAEIPYALPRRRFYE
jgi:transposase